MKRRKDARHVRIYHYMSRTPAWKSLNGNERATYLLLSERYMGLNNGKIPYSVREIATDLRISKDTACRCLQRLQERGFIVAITKGAFSLKKLHATEWRLTEHVCNRSGHGPTSEYRNWRPEIQNTVPVVGPSGPCSRTDVAKIARNGPCSRTVKGQKPHPRSDQRDTLSYQVPPVKAERASAPEGSAEASERGVPPSLRLAPMCWATPKLTEVLDPAERAAVQAYWRPKIALADFRAANPFKNHPTGMRSLDI